jgi:hypothetical protein
MPPLHQQLTLAMNTDQPALSLRHAIKRSLDTGSDRDAIVNDLHQLRRQSSASEEDVILEVLDFLHGWACPDLRL